MRFQPSAETSLPLPGMRLPKSDEDTPIADEDPSESFPLSLKKCITLASAASFSPGVVLLAVISAKVSRNVDRF